MSTYTSTYTDKRHTPPVTFTVVGDGVYVAPSGSDALCEIGCGDCFTRLSREELRELAEGILRALDAS